MAAFLSVAQSAQLQATVVAMRSASRDVRTDINQQTRAVAEPEWKQAMAQQFPQSVQQYRMLTATAKVSATGQGSTMRVAVRAAGSRRKVLSGGATPNRYGRAFEFGAKRPHGAQLPGYRKRGYVFMPALAEMAPRIISLWAQTAIRRVHLAIEGRR